MIIGHGGNLIRAAQQCGCLPEDIIDMSSNLNPLGPPNGLVDYLKENFDTIHALPEADAATLCSLVSERYGVKPENILAGNGSTQLIYLIPQQLNLKHVMIVGPTYADYWDACSLAGSYPVYYITEKEKDFKPDISQLSDAITSGGKSFESESGFDAVFICNPNNPTGTFLPNEALLDLCKKHPDVLFIIDESYLPFICAPYKASMTSYSLSNVLVLNSMSKVFRIPGLRTGFLNGPESIIQKLSKYMLPWSVNALAQKAVSWLLTNPKDIDGFLFKTHEFVKQERNRFIESLSGVSALRFIPGEMFFVLAELSGGWTSENLYSEILKSRILIRDCSNFTGLSNNYVRFSLKDSKTNDMLISAICDAFHTPK